MAVKIVSGTEIFAARVTSVLFQLEMNHSDVVCGVTFLREGGPAVCAQPLSGHGRLHVNARRCLPVNARRCLPVNARLDLQTCQVATSCLVPFNGVPTDT